LCILLDNYHQWLDYVKNPKTWISAIDKQRYFEDRGYVTFRINVAEWKINKNQILKNLKAQII
jgi:hypothetical protein